MIQVRNGLNFDQQVVDSNIAKIRSVEFECAGILLAQRGNLPFAALATVDQHGIIHAF